MTQLSPKSCEQKFAGCFGENVCFPQRGTFAALNVFLLPANLDVLLVGGGRLHQPPYNSEEKAKELSNMFHHRIVSRCYAFQESLSIRDVIFIFLYQVLSVVGS